ncbi:hypothetical protein Scep_007607 [Stephania cephalantha]|uniref:Uncharacterized protein n=1 Tax=Stephania cephalantha TaxID=152367 RepID=A0AAP0KBH3_9MAGN
MGTVKDDPRACLGHHAKARPSDPWFGHPEPVGLNRAPASTSVPGHGQAPPSSSCPVEKHGPRPLRRGEIESRTGVLVGYVTTYWLFYKARGSRLGEA